MNTHETYMQRCIELAQLGASNVAPNPMVGSVLVYENIIISEGYHKQYGKAHAEVNCIQAVPESQKHLIEKSTLYVSLEPCSHTGNTPPCVDLILKYGIKKVVIGCKDSSSKVNGQGILKLQNNGVEVITPMLENECKELNKRFIFFQQYKQPFIILKWAQSQDGFISKKNEQIQISNSFSNRLVHSWRTKEQAIMIGYNTVLIDNPKLTARLAVGNNPVRIVLDKYLTLPTSLHIFDASAPTIIFNFLENKKNNNIEYMQVNKDSYWIDMMRILYHKNILSILVEGGAKLHNYIIKSNYWHEARVLQNKLLLSDGVQAPTLTHSIFTHKQQVLNDTITYSKNARQAV